MQLQGSARASLALRWCGSFTPFYGTELRRWCIEEVLQSHCLFSWIKSSSFQGENLPFVKGGGSPSLRLNRILIYGGGAMCEGAEWVSARTLDLERPIEAGCVLQEPSSPTPARERHCSPASHLWCWSTERSIRLGPPCHPCTPGQQHSDIGKQSPDTQICFNHQA